MFLVTPTGFKPVTGWSVVSYSIQLSYATICLLWFCDCKGTVFSLTDQTFWILFFRKTSQELQLTDTWIVKHRSVINTILIIGKKCRVEDKWNPNLQDRKRLSYTGNVWKELFRELHSCQETEKWRKRKLFKVILLKFCRILGEIPPVRSCSWIGTQKKFDRNSEENHRNFRIGKKEKNHKKRRIVCFTHTKKGDYQSLLSDVIRSAQRESTFLLRFPIEGMVIKSVRCYA